MLGDWRQRALPILDFCGHGAIVAPWQPVARHAPIAPLRLHQHPHVCRRSPPTALSYRRARFSGARADFGFGRDRGEAEAREMAEAMAWARDHQELLALKWAELNERG